MAAKRKRKRKTLTREQVVRVLRVIFQGRTGLCHALSELADEGLITHRQRLNLSNAIYQARPYHAHPLRHDLVGGYLFPWKEQQAKPDDERLAFIDKTFGVKRRGR